MNVYLLCYKHDKECASYVVLTAYANESMAIKERLQLIALGRYQETELEIFSRTVRE